MANLRFKALEALLLRQPMEEAIAEQPLHALYASNVFAEHTMHKYVSEEAVRALQDNDAGTLDRKLADEIASGMKTWALSRGVTHYTHWFHPLTGLTAEKHDAFFTLVDGRPIERFSGGELVQQEPDASSFPSGGIRNTFEARGYTGWDPSSPAFILGSTLCIPSVFISYTGEALDYKGPLLKAIARISDAAAAVCEYFERGVSSVQVTLGAEQEYFLVDRALNDTRPDLVLAGRTVLGASPARGQQLEDHYFGSIPPRVQAFMIELETEALKLGIPLKTRHNEVAPGQFECAPFFEEMNIAVDHNQLLMDLMERVARRHNLRALLHEKPFAGVNGSGKHNNWSLVTNLGRNLLSPGKAPKDNFQFLTFLVVTLKAIHTHADLLRAAIATAANDHRLGANEAPPAIISVFLGTELNEILDELEKSNAQQRINPKSPLKLNISRMPQLQKDTTDRNRTSPFAFTGNKFEFRAVGSSQNIAAPMLVLNTIIADQLIHFKRTVDERIQAGEAKEVALVEVMRQHIVESKPIRFEGNGYSDEWRQEAERRGLSNFTNTPAALDALISPATVQLFERLEVLTERELHARYEIRLETYVKKVEIESQVLAELATTHVLPAAYAYQRELCQSASSLAGLGFTQTAYQALMNQIRVIVEHTEAVAQGLQQMEKARQTANELQEPKAKAVAYQQQVLPHFITLRQHADALESLVDDEHWPLPKYREMLFLK